MHQSLYCLAASIVPVFIAAMSDYQSQAPKDKCCRCYDWLQQILIFKYRWYYPPRNGFPHSSSFKKSPAHLYLTRQLSRPSSPNAAVLCGEAPPRRRFGTGRSVPARCGCCWAARPHRHGAAAPGQNTAVPHHAFGLSVQPAATARNRGEGQQGCCPPANVGSERRGVKPRRTLGPSPPARLTAFLPTGASESLLTPGPCLHPQPRTAVGAGARQDLPPRDRSVPGHQPEQGTREGQSGNCASKVKLGFALRNH